jgi:hypothetical protein
MEVKAQVSTLEPQAGLLIKEFGQLKSSLLVGLHILISTEPMRNQEAPPILKELRELVKALTGNKNA